MGSIGAWLLATWLASAAAPGALGRHLAGEAEALGLPLAFAAGPAGELPVRFHRRPDWRLAHYRPRARGADGELLLFAPAYLEGLGWRPLRRLPVDASEHLFHALLLVHLERLAAGPAAAQLAAIAEATMADVPAEHRPAATRDALASFGAHLLSLRGEIGRKRSRGGPQSPLCRALRRRHPFFRLWEAAFTGGSFPGAWDPDGGRPLAHSRGGLGRDERLWLVREVLGEDWSGDLERDLGPPVCGEAAIDGS